MDVLRETPDVATKPQYYDLANILVPQDVRVKRELASTIRSRRCGAIQPREGVGCFLARAGKTCLSYRIRNVMAALELDGSMWFIALRCSRPSAANPKVGSSAEILDASKMTERALAFAVSDASKVAHARDFSDGHTTLCYKNVLCCSVIKHHHKVIISYHIIHKYNSLYHNVLHWYALYTLYN